MNEAAQRDSAVRTIQSLREQMAEAKAKGADISVAESHFSRMRYYFEKRQFGKVEEIVSQIVDVLKRVEEETHKFDIYQKVLVQAMDDGIITSDENRILRAIRKRMNISEEEHEMINKRIRTASSFTLAAYESALEQAMMDGVITKEEQDMLDSFRRAARLSTKDHQNLVEKIKKKSLLYVKSQGGRRSLFEEPFERALEETEDDEVGAAGPAAGEDGGAVEGAPEEEEEAMDMADPNYWVEQGKLLWYASDDLERDFNDIIERFQNAIELDPENPQAWAGLGAFLKKMGRLENSLDCFDMALRLDPDFINPLYNKALVLISLGDLHKAVEILDEVLARDPENKQAKAKKALLLQALED